jgi:hypothetical protein
MAPAAHATPDTPAPAAGRLRLGAAAVRALVTHRLAAAGLARYRVGVVRIVCPEVAEVTVLNERGWPVLYVQVDRATGRVLDYD